MSEENTTLKLDYTIKEPAARVELVNKIIASVSFLCNIIRNILRRLTKIREKTDAFSLILS